MTNITVSVTIQRPPEEIFRFISNPENNPKWQDGMVNCEITSAEPFGVGSTYKQWAKFMGRDVISRFEIVGYEAGRCVKGKTVESTFPITFERTVDPLKGGGARVTAVISGDATGVFRLFSPLLDWMVHRSVKKDYANLKRLLESKDADL